MTRTVQFARIADVTLTKYIGNTTAPWEVHVVGDFANDRMFDDFADALTHTMARVAAEDQPVLDKWIGNEARNIPGYGEEWHIAIEDDVPFAFWEEGE